MTGSSLISERREAKLDLPEPPRPRMTTRSTWLRVIAACGWRPVPLTDRHAEAGNGGMRLGPTIRLVDDAEPMRVARPGESERWRLGRNSEVAWINNATTPGLGATSAIPPSYDRYATIIVPDDHAATECSDAAILAVLSARTPLQPWWLGYLDTGVADIVFPEAPTVTVYTGWRYVLVEAGPSQAASWRRTTNTTPWHGGLPELLFPADRSWLVSTLWDDDLRRVGGPGAVIEALVQHPGLDRRAVTLDEDATPPRHVAI